MKYSDVHVDREQEDYVSLSFSTISAVGPNASIIHYTCEIANIFLSEFYI